MKARIEPPDNAELKTAANPSQFLTTMRILNWLGGLPLRVDPSIPRTQLMTRSKISFWKSLIITILLPGLPIGLLLWIGAKEGITFETIRWFVELNWIEVIWVYFVPPVSILIFSVENIGRLFSFQDFSVESEPEQHWHISSVYVQCIDPFIWS